MNSALTPVVVKLKHRHASSADNVFDAWTQPALASQFLFSSEDGETIDCEIEAQTPGNFKITKRLCASDGHNGEQTVEYIGHYIEAIGPTRLVFSFSVPAFSSDETVAAIDFAPLSTGGCDVMLSHSLGSSETARQAAASAEETWKKMLQSLDKVLTAEAA